MHELACMLSRYPPPSALGSSRTSSCWLAACWQGLGCRLLPIHVRAHAWHVHTAHLPHLRRLHAHDANRVSRFRRNQRVGFAHEVRNVALFDGGGRDPANTIGSVPAWCSAGHAQRGRHAWHGRAQQRSSHARLLCAAHRRATMAMACTQCQIGDMMCIAHADGCAMVFTAICLCEELGGMGSMGGWSKQLISPLTGQCCA